MKTETPLMKQYAEMKKKHPDTILLFRVGDFYEIFSEDAVVASEILGIVLTTRGNGTSTSIALAGFPHHALDYYLPKLIRAGKRVAICEQLEDPKVTKTLQKQLSLEELITKEQEALRDHLEEHDYSVYLSVQDNEIMAECERYTKGGVDMIMTLAPFSYEQLKIYWNNFDVDEEIDLHRQDPTYRQHFTIRQSLDDFEEWKKQLAATIISFNPNIK